MALADPAVGIGSLKIPLSIKRLQPTGRAYSIGVWSHYQLLDWTEHSTAFRCWLLNDAGETVLFFDSVHLQEVRDEHLQKVLQASGRLGAEQQALYSTLWRPLDKPENFQASTSGFAGGGAPFLGFKGWGFHAMIRVEGLGFERLGRNVRHPPQGFHAQCS
ncbi:eryA [Symbiodinium pilosum]|uniref:EryA protein n=1 Tax=Symbiodinium pilosum TaxID=2952 RepID=A0A812P402_SYMPI|nr:eryA [Symbiodinium pilosum]